MIGHCQPLHFVLDTMARGFKGDFGLFYPFGVGGTKSSTMKVNIRGRSSLLILNGKGISTRHREKGLIQTRWGTTDGQEKTPHLTGVLQKPDVLAVGTR